MGLSWCWRILIVLFGSALLVSLAQLAYPQERESIDLFDARSRRAGRVEVDRGTGTVDVYDARSRRLGYGKIAPGGGVDFYSPNSRRSGTGAAPLRRGR